MSGLDLPEETMRKLTDLATAMGQSLEQTVDQGITLLAITRALSPPAIYLTPKNNKENLDG